MEFTDISYDRCRARVLVIYTGGTLGMLPSDPGNPASPLRPGTERELLDLFGSALPHLGAAAGIFWQIRCIPGEDPYDSSDINAEHWLRIATFIEQEYDGWDGFVVIHGTDTMAYTASGLSFLLENLAKPVVLTGSQLPLSDERSDARSNFANALYVAGFKATRLQCIPEVVICFGHVLLRGNRARKVSTADLNGFDSPNYPFLGSLREHIEINGRLLRPVPDNTRQPFRALKQLCLDVMDITLFPGMRPEHLAALLRSPHLKGLLVRTFGAGNIMNDPKIIEELRSAAERGVIILNITQCLRGRVEMGQYVNSSALLDIGVASGSDMTPEAGLAKLMWVLATAPENDRNKTLQIDARGEQTTDLIEVRDRYLPTRKLERAILRVSGDDVQCAGDFEVPVLLGEHVLATFRGKAACRRHTFVKDVTSELEALGRCDIDLALRLERCEAFECKELRLLVFAGSAANVGSTGQP